MSEWIVVSIIVGIVIVLTVRALYREASGKGQAAAVVRQPKSAARAQTAVRPMTPCRKKGAAHECGRAIEPIYV